MRHIRIALIFSLAVFLTACASAQSAQVTAGETASAEAAAAAEPAPREYITLGNTSGFKAGATTVFITGSNRGIGLEFVKQMKGRGWNIIATSRKPAKSEELVALMDGYPQLIIEELDVTDHPRIEQLAAKYTGQPIDILLSNAGIVPRAKSAFAKSKGVDYDNARASVEVNAFAPLKLASAFMPLVEASEQKKIVVISSKAGSFALSPKMPMMFSYRASKAALNMMVYTLSFETKAKGVSVTALSPGQVNTTPGFKMKGNIEPDESVSKLLAVIDGLSMENNGQFLDYADGRLLPW